YLLGGYCLGAPVASEMALQLRAEGEDVAMLVLLDPRFKRPAGPRYWDWRLRRDLSIARARVRQPRLALAIARRVGRTVGPAPPPVGPIAKSLGKIRENHEPRPFDLPASVIVSEEFTRLVLPTWRIEAIVE